ncbi:MAG: AMP-binding protein [Deltaproteobacteria bacterium]|nr:AMP-binding protein [Deltaproteobacteria bacterium]
MDPRDLSTLAQLTAEHAGAVGVDVVAIDAFRDAPEVVLRESFAAEELAYARGRGDPSASLAAAWAAKEALLKALGSGLGAGLVAPHELRLAHERDGAPRLLFGSAAAARLGVSPEELAVSVSHAAGVAVAVVALPEGKRPSLAPQPMGKTGGVKNYEKSRGDVLALLKGLSAAEAPPPPEVHADGPLYAALMARADDPELGPIFTLARRCGLEFRLVAPHPQAFENLDNAEESNDFRKLAPYAQLHVLVLTLDAESYAATVAQAPLAAGARGAVLVNAGLLDGPPELADARDVLLRSELLHEAVHFEDPTFRAEGDAVVGQWIEEAAGLARQASRLAQADAALRGRAEALITDTLEGNPVRGSFDLELGDGTGRRIASKTFMVLEMELAELHRSFGTLTPDGMNPALFRLVDRLLGEAELYRPETATVSARGLEEVLRFATQYDKDLRRPVQRELGVQLQELLLPPDAAERVRLQLARVTGLLDGSLEPSFPEPAIAAAAPQAAASETAVAGAASVVAQDPFVAERERRCVGRSVTPSRHRPRRLGTLVREGDDWQQAQAVGEVVVDLRRPRVSTEALLEARAACLARARAFVAEGGTVTLRLARELPQALDELRAFVAALGSSVTDVVAEVERPEQVFRLDDELLELERELGLPSGVVGLELELGTPRALLEAERLATATPRVSALELGATLPALLGWVFRPRPSESSTQAVLRRLVELEQALAPARARVRPVARAEGLALLRGPFGLGALPDEGTPFGQLARDYDGLRVTGPTAAARLHAHLPDPELATRLETLEQAVAGTQVADPAGAFRLEEDLRVLEAAVARGALPEAELERYWRARWRLLYDVGVPTEIPIPDRNLAEVLLEAAERRPDRCFRYRAEGVDAAGRRVPLSADVPFARLLGPDAYRMARIFDELGVVVGDRVAVSTSNTLANVAAFQAAALVGAVLVPLDPTKAHLADRFFNDAEVKLLVFDPGGDVDDAELHHARLMSWVRERGLDEDPVVVSELRRARRKLGAEDAEVALQALVQLLPEENRGEFVALWRRKLDPCRKFAETLPLVPSLRAVLLARVEDFVPDAAETALGSGVEELTRALGGRVRVELLGKLLPGVSDAPLSPRVGGGDQLAWPYTGGTTTGVSKAAVHTHRSLLALGLQRGLSMIPDGDQKRHAVVTTLPFTHTYGFATGVLTPVLTGADAVVVPNTGPRYLSTVAEGLVQEGATVLFSSRSALATLVRLVPETARLALERIASSGDTLTPAVTEAWRSRFGVTPCSGYGSTETPSSLMNPRRTNRAGTEGIPVPNAEARIVHPETEAVLPPGVPGLLQLRGPHLAQGYAHRPDADAKAKRPGGWWQKDDIFKIDTDGYFVFCGRADDMFTVNELNVYPETVEQALLGIPGVAEAAVIGVFDPNLETNRVKAFVVPEAGADLTAESVMEAARGLLEAHEAPTLVELTESLDKSNFGKLARSSLRKKETQKETERKEARAQAPAAAPQPPPELDPRRTALVFPTGGSHWPGMGADLELEEEGRELLARAEAALALEGVPKGALRALMIGAGQAERVQQAEGFRWSGDFPLSVAAQTTVSVALARAFARTYGAPSLVLGESMGELAAYAVSGTLAFEDAVRVSYRLAQALARASDHLGHFRMAVVEQLPAEKLAPICDAVGARVVISESPTLFVVGLMLDHLPQLEAAVSAAGARVLVSNNPCVAHDPRLAADVKTWTEYRALVEGLALHPPTTPIASALEPGRLLEDEHALRQNLLDTVTSAVRWGETVATLPDRGVELLLQLGANASAYALEKLRAEGELPEATRIASVGTLGGVETLDALPGRCWVGEPVTVDEVRIRALAQASGDRNSYHLDAEYARRTQYGTVILHGVGSQGLVLAELGRRLPSLEVTRTEVLSFKQPVKVGDAVRPVIQVLAQRPGELHVSFTALNGWGDLLLDGEAWLSPRAESQPAGEAVELAAYGREVTAFAPRPAPEFAPGESGEFSFALDDARIGATRAIFGGGDAAFAAALGLELVSFASASFVPGFVLTGTRLWDVRRALAEFRRGLRRAGIDDGDLARGLEGAATCQALLDLLPLSGRAGRQLRKALPDTVEAAVNALLLDERRRALLLATLFRAEEPLSAGPLLVRTVVEELQGQAPERRVRIGMEVTDQAGRLLYLGGVEKAEAPLADDAEAELSADETLSRKLLQQKIINVFPVTRPRDAENSAADPAVNAALMDLEDAVSPTMRREARPRAVELIRRVRRDSPAVKKALVSALQMARSRLKQPNLSQALLDPAVVDLETLVERLEFRKRGAEELREAMKRPTQRLLKAYLGSAGTRRALVESVGHLDFGGKVLKLRPNNVRTDAAAADYLEVVRLVGEKLDALTIPKSRTPDEIVAIDRVLTAIELERGIEVGRLKLELLIEHPLAVAQIDAIAAASPRTIALVYGHVDYVAATRGWDQNAQFDYQRYAKVATVRAAHANGQIAIDAITPAISAEWAKADAERSVVMGFDGKWSIHLDHIAGIRQVTFPAPRLKVRRHAGAAQFAEGPFSMEELSRLAGQGLPLVPGTLPAPRERLADRRATLRVGGPAKAWPTARGLQLDLRGETAPDDEMRARLRAVGEGASVVLSPDASHGALGLARQLSRTLVLEARPGGAPITEERLRAAAEVFADGAILLSLTRPEELEGVFGWALRCRQVTGLIHSLGPADQWETSGAVVAIATALELDALQGIDPEPADGPRRRRAVRAAHLGLRGQLTLQATDLAALEEAYTPPPELVAEAAAIVERYYKAERIEHLGAIPYEFVYGVEGPTRGLVDAATAKIYDGVLARAEELEVLSEAQREIYRSFTLRYRWNETGEEVDFTRWQWAPGSTTELQLRSDPETRASLGEGVGQFARSV